MTICRIFLIFDGLLGKKLDSANFATFCSIGRFSEIHRFQFFAWQTVKNGQNWKISLYYVQTDRLASKTKVSLVFEDRPSKMSFTPNPKKGSKFEIENSYENDMLHKLRRGCKKSKYQQPYQLSISCKIVTIIFK